MNILEQKSISPSKLGLLWFLKLNSTSSEYIHMILKEYLFEFETESGRKPLEILESEGYIKFIKTYPKSRPWEGVRLSEMGEKVLKELNQKPLHELSEYTLTYVKKEYERIGAEKAWITGGGKLMNYISEFLYSRPAEYNERMVRAVITAFCNSFEHGDKKYLNKMSTLFYKPQNVYATKFSVEDSPLHKFIESNQDLIRHYYKKLI